MHRLQAQFYTTPAFTQSITITSFRIHSASGLSPQRRYIPFHSHRSLSMSAKSSNQLYPAKTVVITGASGGIGEQTAKGLVRTLPNLEEIYLCCRDTEKGNQVAQPLRDGLVAGRKIDVQVIPIELTDWNSINSCSDQILKCLQNKPLDLLICNAGIMASPLDYARNQQGEHYQNIEKQFAVNHLSHALLTDRLLGSLRSGDGGRIIFVSSLAVSISRARSRAPLIEEKTNDVVTETNYSRWKAYGDSKLAMSLYAKALAEKENGIIESVSLHPGVVQTELGRYLVPESIAKRMKARKEPGILSKVMSSVFGFKTAEQGAELSIELASAAKGSLDNGMMYIGVGGKQADDRLIPLLKKEEEWNRVFEDTRAFVNAV